MPRAAVSEEMPHPKPKDRHKGVLVQTRLSRATYAELVKRSHALELGSVSAFLKFWVRHTFDLHPVKGPR